jgi:hypothetical protein
MINLVIVGYIHPNLEDRPDFIMPINVFAVIVIWRTRQQYAMLVENRSRII